MEDLPLTFSDGTQLLIDPQYVISTIDVTDHKWLITATSVD